MKNPIERKNAVSIRTLVVSSMAVSALAVVLTYAMKPAEAQGAGARVQQLTPEQIQAMIDAGVADKVSTSGMADAVMAVLPFASTVPPTEAVTPAAGTAPTIRRGDAVAPRITRSTTVVTQSGGTFSGTWATPLANPNPVVTLTPIAANASIDCQLTAAPTTTGFQGRCWTAQTTTLNLSIITAGLTLNPMVNTAAGISVQVLAIPSTQ